MDLNHHPAPPRNPDPPEIIRHLSETLEHPSVQGVGLTTTSKGEWALLVNVKRGAPIPIPEIEQQAHGYPVIYVQTHDLPVARPAYPNRGE